MVWGSIKTPNKRLLLLAQDTASIQLAAAASRPHTDTQTGEARTSIGGGLTCRHRDKPDFKVAGKQAEPNSKALTLRPAG